MSRSLLATALVLLTASACARPQQSDRAEIAANYQYRYQGKCSSWLYSFQTGFKYCASPAMKLDPLVPAEFVEKPKDGPVTMEALMARGEEVYKVCAACHQADGKGVPGQYPPLAGAGSFYGDPKNMAGIVVNGLSGRITVLGVDYEGAMPPQAQLTDYEIAAVTTYVRNSFGNNDGMVTPDDVKAVRPR